MKNAIFILIAIAALMLAGCAQKYPDTNVSVAPQNETPTLEEKPPADIVEKRGIKTNITEFSELVQRASKLRSFKYNLSDTKYNDEYRFYVKDRFVKVILPEVQQHKTGEIYDEVFMDRVTKTAFSHCGINNCPKPNTDRELEKVQYDDYYISDPLEYLYKATTPTYIGEEMLGDQYTKVYDIMFEGKPGKIWLQEYYGFPLVIEVGTRKIEFKDLMVDATRSGETDLPFNFTVKGESKHWYFWEHYLGEWPKPGVPAEKALKELMNATANAKPIFGV